MSFGSEGLTSDIARERLINSLRRKQIRSDEVLDIMSSVPRHRFVDTALAYRAYDDTVLPIPYGQSISQPHVVALMTQAVAETQQRHRVLEIGSGCGYQTAILSHLFDEVYTVERIRNLSRDAKQTLSELGYENVCFRVGDGHEGWSEHAPFDAIVCTAACRQIPSELTQQVSHSGRLVLPVVAEDNVGQELVQVAWQEGRPVTSKLANVQFVPMLAGTEL